MSTVNIRRQGGAAIMTIPSDVLRSLGLKIGEALEVSVVDGALHARARPKRKHYTLQELLAESHGPEEPDAAERAWLDAPATGREII